MALYLLPVLAALLALSAAASPNPESQALVHRHTGPPEPTAPPDLSKDYDLLDTVLVASVDGKFHALNRSSGHTLWSMSSGSTTSQSSSLAIPSSLAPLVRTTHPKHEPDSYAYDDPDEAADSETYIIEPQSGDIYVLHSPSSPLQRFPFSMPELVDIAPFTSVNGEDVRVFVGKKESSLLLIELETGRIKATLNAECPFIPDEYQDAPLDLDELDGSKPPVSAPTEVYIGRTDYIISIHKKPKPGQPVPPPQELSFSTYGPNNKDNHLQAIYRHTNDDTYIQSLTNGEIIAFHAPAPGPITTDADGNPKEPKQEGGRALWGNKFGAPVVAIFDILRPRSPIPHHHHTTPHGHPFVLLQPRPRLHDLFPKLSPPSTGSDPNTKSSSGSSSSPDPLLAKLDTAYVGLVQDSESLFVMSPEHYPLVVFGGGGGERHGLRRKALGGPKEKDPDSDTTVTDPANPDPNTDADKDAEDTESDLDTCLANPHAPRCLVGVRPLEDADGIEDRMRRLLDGPKQVQLQGAAGQQPMGGSPPPAPPVVVSRPWTGGGMEDNDNANDSGTRRPLGIEGGFSASGTISSSAAPSFSSRMIGHEPSARAGGGMGTGVGGVWEALGVTLLCGLVAVWVLWGRVKARVGKAVAEEKAKVKAEEGEEVHVDGDAHAGILPDDDGENNDANATIISTPQLGSESTSSSTSSSSSKAANGHVPPPIQTNGTPKKPPSIPLPLHPQTPLLDVPTPTPLATSIPIPDTPTPNTAASTTADGDEESDAEGAEGQEGQEGADAGRGKRKARRGKRGKKKKGGVVLAGGEEDGNGKENGKEDKEEQEKEKEEKPSSLVLTTSAPKQPVVQQPSLIVSDNILGFGSHGTVVFKGSLQGRAVAVKRLLNDFVTLALREVSILQESDDHPNVIRYYYQESHGNFLYIALELCPASLADIIEAPDREQWRDIAIGFDPKRALKQVAAGLRHLHALKLVHRDIKPQNILISAAKPGVTGGWGGGANGRAGGYRMLISDFGLCKRLDVDQTSFLPTAHGAAGAGTVGWRAPEILRGEVKLDDVSAGEEGSFSSRGSVATVVSSGSGGPGTPTTGTAPTRLTKSVDIFALGCLFYYTLTNGGHPYGDRFEREVNIMRDEKDLSGLERFGEEGTEATHLIQGMVSFEAKGRPDTTTILLHPFFWDPGRRLNFLQDASDRFEIMCRDPKDAHLLSLETGAQKVVGNDWHARLDRVFIENLGHPNRYHPHLPLPLAVIAVVFSDPFLSTNL
ncbi:hypothetical protein GALMADRAFT_246698 [Galerina marginata CBS 339.88]|uniref:non-specific serine/threonine protein kinase n=1 Tax=Galerina marginata (strain CBS 339.88) TaxID=685588 RepID=A0A067TBQ7_GALM3|nr:hypothetical protein GALMADRAFT_246698 [Galerina marginata CBS 339.88]